MTIDEIVRGVGIALGTFSLDTCAVFDSNSDGEVTIDELLLAVRFAVAACPE